MPALQPLSLAERRTLAREVLGPDAHETLVNDLARVSRDAPVVATIGGILIREQKIGPARLTTSREFSDAITRGFRETIEGSIRPIPYGADLRHLLHAIAATSPIRPDDDEYLVALAAWMNLRPSAVREILSLLQDIGVLGRRGRMLHVAPEVLVDIMLMEACTDTQGRSTGYAVEVFDHFRDACPERVVANLAQLDWHLRSMDGMEVEPRLFDQIWERLREDYRMGTVRSRTGILALVRGLAAAQPTETLSFCDLVLREEEDPYLIQGLTTILDPLGEEPRTVRRAVQLLWELGRDDPRSPGQNPDHGFRILLDLAGFDPRRLYLINKMVIRAATRWLGTPEAHDHAHDPLDIIAKALSPTAHYGYMNGSQYVYGHVPVDIQEVRPIREIALAALGDAVVDARDRVAQRACKHVIEALRSLIPGGPGGIEDGQFSLWEPHVDRLLELVSRAMREGSPIAQLCIGKGLCEFDRANVPEVMRIRVQEITRQLDLTPEFQRYAVLGNGWDLWLNGDDERGWDARSAKLEQLLSRLLATMFADLDGTDARVEAIETTVARLSVAGVESQPGDFFAYLGQHEPDLLNALIVRALSPSAGGLARWAGNLIFELFKTSPELARTHMWALLDEGDVDILRRVASWGRICAGAANGDDIALIRRLLTIQDAIVRSSVLQSLDALLMRHVDPVIEILLGEAEMRDGVASLVLAEAIAVLIERDPKAVSDGIIARAIPCIGALPRLEDFWVRHVLTLAYERDPEQVIDMLLQRTFSAASGHIDPLYAMPLRVGGFTLPTLKDAERTAGILRTVRQHALDDRWQIEVTIPDLFAVIAESDWELALPVIEEWARSENDDQILAATRLLRGVPQEFIFSHVEFIATVLEHVAPRAEAIRSSVECNLFHSVLSGSGRRTPGSFQGFDRDHLLLDRSSAVLETLTVGNAAYRFYEGVRAHASASIREEQLRDDEEFG